MTLNEYQKKAMTTCMASSENFAYMMLNLVGEVGEFAGKVAKAIRKEWVKVNGNDLDNTYTCEPINDGKIRFIPSNEERQAYNDELRKEAGDILWQLSGLCSVMGWSLEEIAKENLDKLADRKGRGVIDGSGDNR